MVIDPRELTFRRNPTAILEGQIDRDVTCVACGYNLRGLKPMATCPECGLPIGRSLAPDALYADPNWIRRLIWGCNMLMIALLLALALTSALAFATARRTSSNQLGFTAPGMYWGAIVAFTVGWTIFTIREPGDHRHDKPVLRHLSRWSVLLHFGLFSLLDLADIDIYAPVGLALLFIAFTCPLHFRNVAQRFRLDDLGNSAMWLIAPIFLYAAAILVAWAAFAGAPSWGAAIITSCWLTATLFILTVSSNLWAIGLLIRLRTSLNHIIHPDRT